MRFFLSVFGVLLFFSTTAYGESGRYFLEGDGALSICNEKTKKTVSVIYRLPNGDYDSEALDQLNMVFGMPEDLLKEDISLRLISMLDYLQDHFSPGQTLNLLSGYRSPSYNSKLRRRGRRAAKTSYHMEGMAADVIFPQASPREIWEYVRGLNCCGIGYYHGKAVHVDSGKPRFWTQESAIHKYDDKLKNRPIYLSVDKDIYYAGESVRLFLSGISDYPFGVRPTFQLVKEDRVLLNFNPQFYAKQGIAPEECRPIHDRRDARFIYWTIPEDYNPPAGPVTVGAQFCGSSFEMPMAVVSKPFVIKPKPKPPIEKTPAELKKEAKEEKKRLKRELKTQKVPAPHLPQ